MSNFDLPNKELILFKNTGDFFGADSEKKKHFLNWRILVGLLASCFGAALPAGHCLGVINTPQKVMREWVNATALTEYGVGLTKDQDATIWGVIVTAYVAGALFGSFLVSPFSNFFGRKKVLLLNSLIFAISGAMIISCSWYNIIEMLCLGRLISGLATGIGTGLMPLYLSEIAPPSVKGVMGTIFPFGLCTAILISQCLGSANFLGTKTSWTYLVGGHLFYALFCVLFYPLLPSSPTYLYLIRKNKEAALQELIKLRNGDEKTSLKEISELREAYDERNIQGFREILKNSEMRRPLYSVIGLNAGQQFVGINAVFFYSTLVFSKAGLKMGESQMAAMVAGVANLIMSGLALPLVRFFRRRILLIISLVLYLVSLLFLVISLYLVAWYSWAAWIAISSLFISVLSYGMGLGPIPYMIGTELFSSKTRSVGLAIGSASNWGSNLIVGLVFPLLESQLRFYSFLIFIFIGFIFFFFVVFFVPETYKKNGPQSRTDSANTSTDQTPDSIYSQTSEMS